MRKVLKMQVGSKNKILCLQQLPELRNEDPGVSEQNLCNSGRNHDSAGVALFWTVRNDLKL